MPLLRSAARRASRKDEVLPLLADGNGGAEDTASGDAWLSRWVTCIVQRAPMISRLMPHPIDLDHIAIGVHDVQPYLDMFVGEFCATHLGGGQLPGFRAVQVRLGAEGMTLELLQPFLAEKNDFLQRFLDRHGEGPHHMTFKVPDLAATIDFVRSVGLTPVQVDLANPVWKECFLMPHEAHGTVIQLAQSDFHDPEAVTKLETSDLGWGTNWWRDAGMPSGPELTLHAVVITSPDADKTAGFFADVLGGTHQDETDGSHRLTWPGGAMVVVRAGARSGIDHLDMSGVESQTIAGVAFITR